MNRPGGQGKGWFPGYTTAGVAALAFFASAPGQTFIVAQFNTPLREAFGLSELQLSSAYTLATFAAALPLVWVGRWTDELGPRRMMALVALLFGMACMFMGAVQGLAMIYIGFFLLRFLGQASLSMVSQHALAMWFHRKLGRVHGVMQVVVFALWAVMPQVTVWLIDGIGWRQAYMVLGLGVWLLVIPAALLFARNRPEELGLRMDNDPPEEELADESSALPATATGKAGTREPAFTLREAVRTRAYWTLTLVFFLSPLIGTALLFSMQPLGAERGVSIEQAALAISVWTAVMAAMSLPSGFLTDRMPPSILIAFGMFTIGASSLLLMWAQGLSGVMAAMVMLGIGHSITSTAAGTTVARYFGRAHHGAIRSSITRIGVFGTGLGPVFTALSVEFTGTYSLSMIAFAAMCVPPLVLALWLRPPSARD